MKCSLRSRTAKPAGYSASPSEFPITNRRQELTSLRTTDHERHAPHFHMRIHRNPQNSIHGCAVYFNGLLRFTKQTSIPDMKDEIFISPFDTHVRRHAGAENHI